MYIEEIIEKIIIGIIGLTVGFCLVIFRKSFARHVIKEQNKFGGFHFGERDIKSTEVISIIVGIGFIIIGLLSIFQII